MRADQATEALDSDVVQVGYACGPHAAAGFAASVSAATASRVQQSFSGHMMLMNI